MENVEEIEEIPKILKRFIPERSYLLKGWIVIFSFLLLICCVELFILYFVSQD